MYGSVRHRDAETTRNKLRNNKSHLQIAGQNRKNGSVRDTGVLFQLHDGHSSIILNKLSHIFQSEEFRELFDCPTYEVTTCMYVYVRISIQSYRKRWTGFETAIT